MNDQIPKPVTEDDLKNQYTNNQVPEKITQSSIYGFFIGATLFLVIGLFLSWVCLFPSIGLAINPINKIAPHQKGKSLLIIVTAIDIVLLVLFGYAMLTTGTKG